MSIMWIDRGFAVSPQLRPEELPEIAAAGYRGIVNNRPDGEAPEQPTSAAMEAEARRLGLDYAYIPIVPGQLDLEQARALRRFVGQIEGPVLAFCRSGSRSANLWKLSRSAE
jgi:uncharacterized protein (TIGR01244 family)